MTQQKNILITGASKGIGQACALHFVSQGHRVYGGVRKPEDGARLKELGGENVTPLFIDVTKPDMIQAAAAQIEAEVGEAGLWGLVNNAGLAMSGPLEFLPVDNIRRQFEVNYFGQIAVTQAVLPLLRQAKGRVVNISSISGMFVSPFLAPYSGSKHAIETFTDALRRELIPWGIHVAAIEPTSIATPIWDQALANTNKMIDSLPPEAHRLYGPVFDTIRHHAVASGKRGLPPQKVVNAVERALFSRRPRLRYPIGWNSWATAYIVRPFIPPRLIDWAVKMILWRK